MEDNKFFRLVWRFNGPLISVVGILAIGALLFALYLMFKDVTRERTTQNIVNIEESGKAKENWRLGHVTKFPNHKTIMIPLNSEQSFNRGYLSKSSNSTRNYLFIDTKTNTDKWLFDHTNYLIENTIKLRMDEYSSKEPVLAVLYHLAQLDSNGDSRLTPSDLTTVAISKPDGSEYKELLAGVEHIIGSTVLSEKELFIIYQLDGESLSSTIDLATFELSNTKVLPKVGL